MLDLSIDLTKYAVFLKTKMDGGKKYIWDPIRKKWLVLQPEEMVRQLFLYFFIHVLKYPKGRISVEKELKVLGLKKRYDIIVYDRHQKPKLIVECKSFGHKIGQDVLEQVLIYNHVANAPFVVITNGRVTLCLTIKNKKEFIFTNRLPSIK